MKKIGEGIVHEVYEWKSTWFVRKFPILESWNRINYNQAKESLDYLKEHLWGFLPNTRIIQKWESYIIVQERVNWRRLHDIPVQDIQKRTLEQLEALIQKITTLLKSEWVHVDIMWPIFFEKWYSLDDLKLLWVLERKVFNLWLLKDIMASVNILVDEDWNIKLVDNVWEIIYVWKTIWLIRKFILTLYKIRVGILISWKTS